MLKQQHQFFVGLFMAADAAVICAASFGAWLARKLITHVPDYWPTSFESYPKQALVLYTVPIVILTMRFFGLYRPRRDSSLFGEASQILKACGFALLAILAVLFLLEVSFLRELPNPSWPVLILLPHRRMQIDPARVQLAALALILPSAMVIHRTSLRLVLRVLRKRGRNLRHVAIIGHGKLAQIVARTLDRNSWTGIKVSYFIAHTESPRISECTGRPVLGGLADLEDLMTEHKPDAVYVALPGKLSNHVSRVLSRLDRFAVDVRIVPDFSPKYVPQSMTVGELDGMPILSYRESPATGLGGLSKRGLDMVGALGGLVLFSPLMAMVALMVRLSGPGPVIFRQRRVSLGGEVFQIYKFRTMYHVGDERTARIEMECGEGAETNGWTSRNDPRITTIGRWLRRTSLDELPQLLNVLAGDMSLVGPRPERPELIERFRDDWRGYMLRQHVKAGMTGWAQINGHRGDSSLRKRVQYDLFYVKNWSIGFDLKIIMLTFIRGFVHRNAH